MTIKEQQQQEEEITGTAVLLFVPNLIGYARVIAALTSFVIMIGGSSSSDYWLLAVALYLANFVGDLFDGLVARKLNQCSTVGGVLDMVTDRCGTLGIFFVLSAEYKVEEQQLGSFPIVAVRVGFLFLCILDISSHWVQTYSTLLIGQHHHKSEQGNVGRSFLVRWFYKYYWFFGYLCVSAELTWLLCYVQRYLDDSTSPEYVRQAVQWLFVICLPGCLAKQLVNIAQLCSALAAIADHDAEQINQKKKKKQ